jgi:hypothetical protein
VALRALAPLGIELALMHLNERHAAFALLELARGEAVRRAPVQAALEARSAAYGVHHAHARRGRQRDPPPQGRDRTLAGVMARARTIG